MLCEAYGLSCWHLLGSARNFIVSYREGYDVPVVKDRVHCLKGVVSLIVLSEERHVYMYEMC